MKGVGRGTLLRVLLRSFAIQGSWNHRTMLGGGVAFSLLPLLRRLEGGDPEGLSRALSRHAEHFNAHPYLASLALGAVARMEEEGRNPEEIRRFKLAVRGPLGGLGDSLVWVGWRPATVLLALCLALLGLPPAWTVLLFLALYNAGHLFLRIGSFALGWEKGSQVGDSLRKMALPRVADRLSSLAVFLLGASFGLALSRGWAHYGPQALGWGALMGIGVFLGGRIGESSWKWAIRGAGVIIGLFFMIGWIG